MLNQTGSSTDKIISIFQIICIKALYEQWPARFVEWHTQKIYRESDNENSSFKQRVRVAAYC